MSSVLETIVGALSFVVGYIVGTIIFLAVIRIKDKKDGKIKGKR